MGDYIIGIILGALMGFMIGVLVTGSSADWQDKIACEETLPRDVYCTWQPPQGAEGNNQ